jgi:hypothetical protein
VRSSTQGVLPPYLTVLGPGLGIDPRVPQKHTDSPLTSVPGLAFPVRRAERS